MGRPTKDVHFLLRGFAWHHAKRMLCNSRQPRKIMYRYYRCQNARHLYKGDVPTCHLLLAAESLEGPVWSAVWGLIKDPAYFRKLAEALAADEAKKAPKLNRDPAWELENARAEEKQILEMTRARMYTVPQGNELLKALRLRISSLELEVKAMQKVVALPPLNIIEAACRQFAQGEEPFDYEDRREVLEGLLDFRVELAADAKSATVTGRLPLPAVEVVEPVEGRRKKNRSNCLSGAEVHCVDDAPGSDAVQNSVKYDRGSFLMGLRIARRERNIVRPGNAEAAHIGGINLLQGTVALLRPVHAVADPLVTGFAAAL